MIVEVASPSTSRIDEGEKRDSYLTIPTLSTYVLLEQTAAIAVAYQRGEQGFTRQGYETPDAVIGLPELSAELQLARVYDGAEFSQASSEVE